MLRAGPGVGARDAAVEGGDGERVRDQAQGQREQEPQRTLRPCGGIGRAIGGEVRELMEQAERTDRQDEVDGQSLPEEISRRNDLKCKLENV